MKKNYLFLLVILLFVGCKNSQEEILPPTINLIYDSIVAYDGNTVAKWSAINANSVTCNGKSVNPNDSLVLSGVKENVTIIIIAKGEGGTTEKSKTISVKYPMPTLVLEGDTILNYGDSTIIKWKTDAFTGKVTLDGTEVSLNGSKAFNQLVTSESHTITVTGQGGVIEKTFRINVGDWTTSNLGLLTHAPWKLESMKYLYLDGSLFANLNLTEEQKTNYLIYSIDGDCTVYYKNGQDSGLGCNWKFLPNNKILVGDQKRDLYILNKDKYVTRELTQNGYIYELSYVH